MTSVPPVNRADIEQFDDELLKAFWDSYNTEISPSEPITPQNGTQPTRKELEELYFYMRDRREVRLAIFLRTGLIFPECDAERPEFEEERNNWITGLIHSVHAKLMEVGGIVNVDPSSLGNDHFGLCLKMILRDTTEDDAVVEEIRQMAKRLPLNYVNGGAIPQHDTSVSRESDVASTSDTSNNYQELLEMEPSASHDAPASGETDVNSIGEIPNDHQERPEMEPSTSEASSSSDFAQPSSDIKSTADSFYAEEQPCSSTAILNTTPRIERRLSPSPVRPICPKQTLSAIDCLFNSPPRCTSNCSHSSVEVEQTSPSRTPRKNPRQESSDSESDYSPDSQEIVRDIGLPSTQSVRDDLRELMETSPVPKRTKKSLPASPLKKKFKRTPQKTPVKRRRMFVESDDDDDFVVDDDAEIRYEPWTSDSDSNSHLNSNVDALDDRRRHDSSRKQHSIRKNCDSALSTRFPPQKEWRRHDVEQHSKRVLSGSDVTSDDSRGKKQNTAKSVRKWAKGFEKSPGRLELVDHQRAERQTPRQVSATPSCSSEADDKEMVIADRQTTIFKGNCVYVLARKNFMRKFVQHPNGRFICESCRNFGITVEAMQTRTGALKHQRDALHTEKCKLYSVEKVKKLRD